MTGSLAAPDPNAYATVECGHEVMHVDVAVSPLSDGQGQPLPVTTGALITTTRRCCACHVQHGGAPSHGHPQCQRQEQLATSVRAAIRQRWLR